MRVYDTVEISGRKLAILLDDETMTAYEAVWSENNRWETDFSYPSIGVDPFEVAGAFDFKTVEKTGYTFFEK